MTNSLTRRQFLQTSSVSGAAALAAPALLRAGAANERLNVAFIGVGGRGGRNINELAVAKGTKPARGRDARNQRAVPRDDVNVVALCDVNRQNLGRAAEMFPKARTYEDFRKLFDQANDIDAVVVSTTEHTHAYAVLPALQLRKHVYCEKPITHNVVEARLLAEEAARAGVATQMGTQIHGMPNYRRVVELIQSGAIGKVTESHTWVSRAWGLQSAQEAEQNGDIVQVTERPDRGANAAGAPELGPLAGTGAVPAVPRSLFSGAEVGTAGGISATARCPIWEATGTTSPGGP